MMLATRRADVDRLNQLARQHLREQGCLGPDVIAAAGRVFALGDEVICGRNDRRIGVINGTRGTVIGPGADSTGLVIATGDGGEVALPGRYLESGHLSHGYATTIHKAQGATTERTFVLADENLYREAGYVALSRGRARNDIYTATMSEHDNREHRHGPDRRERGDGLSDSMRRSRAQQAAIIVPALPGRSVADLDAERRQLTAGRSDREDMRRRIDVLGRLIDQRVRALGAWALEHPSAEHLEQLGPAPRRPERQAEWARAAGEMSAYKERYGLAYGHEIDPDDRLQRWERNRVEKIIHEVEPALDRGRPVELELEHDRGISL